MAHADRVHLDPVFTQPVTGQLTELHPRAQVIEGYREHDRTHLLPKHQLEAREQRRRAEQPEVIPRLECRREEGESLNVVPVRVAEEHVARDRLTVCLVYQRAAEPAYARTAVEDDEVAVIP